MFTLKHIDTKGIERLYNAETVEVVKDQGNFGNGIFLDRDPVISPADDGRVQQGLSGPISAMQPRSFKHVIHFESARSSGDITPHVFIMNRFGATVAKYNL